MIVSALPAHWRARAAELERYAPAAAEAFNDAANDLEKALDSSADSVSLREAANLGGYSIDHLQRLVRVGSISNVGRKGRPRIRRADVPLKPGHRSADLSAQPARRNFSPTAVVASVIKRGT